VIIGGRKILMFGSYNYLGLSTRPEVKKAAIEAIEKYGIGSGGSRLISGTYDIHIRLEKELADFKKEEDAMTFASGFGTNVGVIAGAMDLLGFEKYKFWQGKSVIFSDELNHASIIDGCRLSHAKVVVYKHNDMHDLEAKLAKYRRRRKLIVTDGVFSMDGDIALLDQIVSLAKEYHALTMVDDAHATGILGLTGAGTAEYFRVEGQVDINMGTSKAFGSVGGFVAGKKELVDFLRIATRSYVFAQSLPPLICAAILQSIKLIKKEPELRDILHKNLDYLRENLKRLGFNTLKSETAIIPILLGPESKAISANSLFFEKGIFAPTVRWPAVAKGQSRVRFVVMATHTKEQIDRLLAVCEDVGKKLKII
jgi:8-amino-7-oxononanoate synthase